MTLSLPAVYNVDDPVIYRRALEPHIAIPSRIENVLPGDKYGIRTVPDNRYCVVKGERLSPVDGIAVESELLDSEPSSDAADLPDAAAHDELNTPRVVNLAYSAITGVCTICAGQYDYIFDTSFVDTPYWLRIAYWASLTNPCPVCKTMQPDADTEELPAVPMIPGAPGDEVNPVEEPDKPEIPLEFEIAAVELPIDPFAHPAVAARVADLNQRLDDMIAAIYAAEARAEAAEDKALQFQLQVLELVRRIPAPSQPRLDKVDLDRLEFLCQRHLKKTFDEALDYLRFSENYALDYPTFDVMCKAIAQRLVDRSLPVLAYECATEVAKNDSLFISLGFGFATLSLFNDKQGDIEHAFAHTRYQHILHDWRSTAFAYTFNPPCQITMKRDHKLYPRLFTLFVMEDEF